MSTERNARRAELLRRVEAAAGAARDHGVTLADVLEATERGWRGAGALGDAMAEADALLASLPGRHRDAA